MYQKVEWLAGKKKDLQKRISTLPGGVGLEVFGSHKVY